MFGYQASSEPLFWSEQHRTAVSFLHLYQCSTSDPKKKKKKERKEITARIQTSLQDLSNKIKKELVSSQLKAHGWIFFRTTMKWSRVFNHSSRVAAIIFLMRRATEPGEFSISSSYYTTFSLLAVSPANLHDTMQPHNTPFAAYLL